LLRGVGKHGGYTLILVGILLMCQCVKEESSTASSPPPAAPRPAAPQVTTTQPERPLPSNIPHPSPENVSGRRQPDQPPRKPTDKVISLSPSPAPPTAPQPAVLAKESDLLSAFPQARIMAEDFKIGPLQDGISSSRDFLQALACVRKFMESVMKKDVDYALVLPASQAAVKAVISYPMKQGYVPQRYRVGKMAYEQQDEVRANVRLYKDDGVTEGEIYVKKADDEWKIADVQVGFTLLGKPYQKPAEPFVPGSYSFLLDE